MEVCLACEPNGSDGCPRENLLRGWVVPQHRTRTGITACCAPYLNVKRLLIDGMEMEKMHVLKSSRERVRVCIVSNKV